MFIWDVEMIKQVRSYFRGNKNVMALFVLGFIITFSNGLLQPLRESLTLFGGKALQARLMGMTILASMIGQIILSYLTSAYGGVVALNICFFVSIAMCLVVFLVLTFYAHLMTTAVTMFYLWFTFFNMSAISIYWALGKFIP